tara:strand:- start:4 stop:1263 length:1260 start_codon:yes stop_codon:yes gene_type:complete
MEIIRNINIDTSSLKAEAIGRVLNVNATSNARYTVRVSRSSDTNLYNFDTDAFAAESSNSNFNGVGSQQIAISFPAAASGDTYTINVFSTNGAEILGSANKLFKSIVLEQVGNSQITFIATGTNFTNTTIGTSTGSTIDSFAASSTPTVVMNEKQITVPSSADDFGFFITSTTSDLNNGEWDSGAFYWQTTEAIVTNPAGDGVLSTTVTVADLTGLVVGMTLVYHKGTTAPSVPGTTISDINISTKTITFSARNAFEESETMTFRAFGPTLIKKAISIGFSITDPTIRLEQTTTSIDDEITSNVAAGGDINVNGTTGIGVGATIRMRGLNKSSSASACTVTAVDNSANGGGITGGALQLGNGQLEASSDRPIRTKTKIYIDGSSNKVFLNGTINISRYPAANQNIYIDMSKITTIGQSS